MKKRWLKVLAAAAIAVGLTGFAGTTAQAEVTIVASGSCVNNHSGNADYVLDSEGTLTISGNGEIIGSFLGPDGREIDYKSIKKVIIEEGITEIGREAFRMWSSLTEITIPDSVTSIGEGVFSDCDKLTSIYIPAGVTKINTFAFMKRDEPVGTNYHGSVNLANITVSPQNSQYSSYNGCLYNKDLTKLIACPIGKSEITIAESVTEIQDDAFSGCHNLASIELPEGINRIGYSAFGWCTGLAGIKLPDSLREIGVNAFVGCSSLVDVKLPKSVISIGAGAFSFCNALTEIRLPESVASIGVYAFGYCDNLKSIYFEGNAPKSENIFNHSAFVFEGITATVYYPAGNSTWTDEIKANYGGNITWIATGAPESNSGSNSGQTEKLEIIKELVTDNVYTKGSASNAVIRCSGEMKDFISVAVDGEIVDKSNYILEEGSTILTFKQEYMDTLSVGEHTVTLSYTKNRKIDTTLTVFEAEKNLTEKPEAKPDTDNNVPTGDSVSVMLWVAVLLLSAGGCFAAVRKKRLV